MVIKHFIPTLKLSYSIIYNNSHNILSTKRKKKVNLILAYTYKTTKDKF